MNIKKLTEELNQVLTENTLIYTGKGKLKVILTTAKGDIEAEVNAQYIPGVEYDVRWDSNLYGVDSAIAVGGYADGDVEIIDAAEIELSDEDYEKYGQDIIVKTILSGEDNIEWEFKDSEPDEPDDYGSDLY
jgi:hypothetical protein